MQNELFFRIKRGLDESLAARTIQDISQLAGVFNVGAALPDNTDEKSKRGFTANFSDEIDKADLVAAINTMEGVEYVRILHPKPLSLRPIL